MKGKVIAVLACAVIVSGCATLGTRYAERNVEKAIALINSGDAGALGRYSSDEFIFGREILLRSSDIEAVWNHLIENGFALINPVVSGTYESDDTTFAVFSESEEMEIFFKKYIPPGSTVGKIETSDGTFYVLLGRGIEGYPAILGITGF